MVRGRLIESPVQVLGGSVRRRHATPEAARATMHLRRSAIAALVAAAGHWLPGIASLLVAALAATIALCELVRAHLPHVSARRFWTVGLVLTGVLTWIPGASEVGQVLFGVIGISFFVLRRHRMLRRLASRQRAAVMTGAVGIVVLFAVTPELADEGGAFRRMLHDVQEIAWTTLLVAAVVTALHLFLGIRLHFLRLRPKLAVAGFLLATVPVVLIAALAIALAYAAVGGSHSTHAMATLQGWLDDLAAGDTVGPGPFGPGFGDVGIVPSVETEVVPAWRDELADAIVHAGFDPVPAGLWVRRDGEMWAIRTVEPEPGARRVLAGGRRLEPSSIQRLADQLRCEVDLLGAGQDDQVSISFGGGDTGSIPIGEGEGRLRARPAGLREAPEVAGGTPWNQRWYVFGGATFGVYDLEAASLDDTNAMLNLRTRPVDLFALLTEESNEINRYVGIGLLVVAILFLMLEAMALYFGLRIVGGITQAVGTLHRATGQLARGDLDVRIDLPNEDEFGDLAEGFNEMTRAIQVAQEQIVEKQRLEQEIATARQIQMRLLPVSLPVVPGYALAAGSTPSKQVGGDYFDFLPLPDGRLGIAVADVSGKGIPAALLMSNLQASLHGQVLHEAPVTDVVERMNEQLARSTDTHMFATFFYGVLDPSTGRIAAVNAGHEPPLIVRANGTIDEMPAGGLILGMLPGQTYREAQAVLEPGDTLVLYTDGITEAMGPGTRIPGFGPLALPGPSTEGEEDDEEFVTDFFGEERLREIVVTHRHEDAENIRRAVLDAVARHVRDVPQSDDVTLVVIQRAKEKAA